MEYFETSQLDRVRLRLQFFAAEGPGGEKTEEATTKKLEDARKEGQVSKSQELTTAVSLLGLFVALKAFIGYVSGSFLDLFTEDYKLIPRIISEGFDMNQATVLMRGGIWDVVIIAMPFLAFAVVIAFVSNVAQVKWKPTGKPLQPKLDRLSPISGFKRLFSMDKIVELIKSIIKVLVIFILVYSMFQDKVDEIFFLYQVDGPTKAVILIGDEVIDLGIKISAFFIVIGFADLIYQKQKFKKDMRMTKQEIKDEYKQTEGDPQIKGRIKQKMREASQRRMMQKLPEADVVITNPTHFACALKYDRSVAEAPVLIAKGADYVAAKIKEVAKDNAIPIVENKPLARMLYYNVDLDQEIPEELYQMTAEVLAYVYGLKNQAS